MNKRGRENAEAPGGLAGWLLARWRRQPGRERRLVLLERISLGPRQTLSLVKADGRNILVANSADGASFYPLESNGARRETDARSGDGRGRVSW